MCYEISIMSGKYCELCDKELGYLDPKYKRYYNGEDPIKANNFLLLKPHKRTGEYRKRCFDCYVKEFGCLPSRQNVESEGLDWLLQIDTSESRKSRAVTLDNLVSKYGVEVGTKKFEDYCRKQSVKNTFEFKKEKYGWTEEQFEEYNKSRAVTLELCIQRHGHERGVDVFNDYCKKQSYAGCALEYFQEKHGLELGEKIYHEVNASKSHNLDNFIKRYGIEEGERKWEEYVKTVPSNFYSKMSADLFTELSALLGNSFDCRFNESEFGLYDKVQERYYKYDFCIPEMKLMIEFNGSYWHADPRIYSESDVIKRRGGGSVVAKDVWLNDDKKLYCARKLGYDIMVVWEQDYLESKEEVIKQCLKFINKG